MRLKNKSYWKTPWGELQFGHVSKRVVLWHKGRDYGTTIDTTVFWLMVAGVILGVILWALVILLLVLL